jgi:hypothetical protein
MPAASHGNLNGVIRCLNDGTHIYNACYPPSEWMEDIAIHHLLFEWIISLHMEDTQNKIIFLGINQNFEEKHAVSALS